MTYSIGVMCTHTMHNVLATASFHLEYQLQPLNSVVLNMGHSGDRERGVIPHTAENKVVGMLERACVCTSMCEGNAVMCGWL